MRRIILATAPVLALAASTASAGTVRFDPPHAGLPSDFRIPIEIDVYVEADAGIFQSVDVLFGSNDALLELVGFEYSESFENEARFLIAPPAPLGIHEKDLYVGGFLISPQETPFFIGTLQLGVIWPDARLIWQEYFVDSSLDGGFSSIGSNLGSEPLHGEGSIVVGIAEPTTALILLAGAGLVSVPVRSYRRRT